MFLRKLLVMAVPLLLVILLVAVVPLLGGLGFWSPVLQGLLIGVAAGLLLPLSGAAKTRAQFGRLLWVPAGVLVLVLAAQYAAAVSANMPLRALFAAADGQTVMIEAMFAGYLGAAAARG